LALEYWRKSSARTKRILTIVAFFLLSLIITFIGVLTPLASEEANEISNELNQTLENMRRMNNFQKTASIFGNNFIICLIMFMPIAGLVFGLYVLYSTGVVIAAESISSELPPPIGFLFLFILPVIWLEFLAYSTAFAESVWLTRRIIQHRGKGELIRTCIFISICAVILLVAAIIEIAMIAKFI